MRPLADILTELHATKAQLDTVKERGGDVDEALTLAEKYRQLSLELEQSRTPNSNYYYGWVSPIVWSIPTPTYNSGWYSTNLLTSNVEKYGTTTLTTLPAEE